MKLATAEMSETQVENLR